MKWSVCFGGVGFWTSVCDHSSRCSSSLACRRTTVWTGAVQAPSLWNRTRWKPPWLTYRALSKDPPYPRTETLHTYLNLQTTSNSSSESALSFVGSPLSEADSVNQVLFFWRLKLKNTPCNPPTDWETANLPCDWTNWRWRNPSRWLPVLDWTDWLTDPRKPKWWLQSDEVVLFLA